MQVVVLTSSVMLCLQAIALCAELIVHKWGARAQTKLKRVQAVCLVCAYFLYSPVTSSLFQVFNCRQIGGKYFLQKDLSLDCSTSKHRSVRTFTCFAVAVIAVGLPLQYFFTLYRHRQALRSGRLRSLEFFVRDYISKWKYW